MILDERLEFGDALALNTGAAATYLIGDVVDLEVARDMGLSGYPVWFVATVDTAATSGGSATLVLTLASDAQAAIATDGTATAHIISRTWAVASLTAGTVIMAAHLPAEGPAYERYLGVLQTTAVAAFTAGKINAFITADYAKWKAWADATN